MPYLLYCCSGSSGTLKVFVLPRAFYRFSATPIKIPMAFFKKIEETSLKFMWKHKQPRIVKILRKKAAQIYKLFFKAIESKPYLTLQIGNRSSLLHPVFCFWLRETSYMNIYLVWVCVWGAGGRGWTWTNQGFFPWKKPKSLYMTEPNQVGCDKRSNSSRRNNNCRG